MAAAAADAGAPEYPSAHACHTTAVSEALPGVLRPSPRRVHARQSRDRHHASLPQLRRGDTRRERRARPGRLPLSPFRRGRIGIGPAGRPLRGAASIPPVRLVSLGDQGGVLGFRPRTGRRAPALAFPRGPHGRRITLETRAPAAHRRSRRVAGTSGCGACGCRCDPHGSHRGHAGDAGRLRRHRRPAADQRARHVHDHQRLDDAARGAGGDGRGAAATTSTSTSWPRRSARRLAS